MTVGPCVELSLVDDRHQQCGLGGRQVVRRESSISLTPWCRRTAMRRKSASSRTNRVGRPPGSTIGTAARVDDRHGLAVAEIPWGIDRSRHYVANDER